MDKLEFKRILEDRLEKRLERMTFDEMTVMGSQLRFEMELAINGYISKIPKDADPKDYESILTDQEYMSGKYDDVIQEVFDAAYDKANES